MIPIPIRQQDGSMVVMYISDSVHNRQLADYIRGHEPFTNETHR